MVGLTSFDPPLLLYYYCFDMQDKGASEIVLKAMGRAINKTVTIAEIIKVLLLLHLSL